MNVPRNVITELTKNIIRNTFYKIVVLLLSSCEYMNLLSYFLYLTKSKLLSYQFIILLNYNLLPNQTMKQLTIDFRKPISQTNISSVNGCFWPYLEILYFKRTFCALSFTSSPTFNILAYALLSDQELGSLYGWDPWKSYCYTINWW